MPRIKLENLLSPLFRKSIVVKKDGGDHLEYYQAEICLEQVVQASFNHGGLNSWGDFKKNILKGESQKAPEILAQRMNPNNTPRAYLRRELPKGALNNPQRRISRSLIESYLENGTPIIYFNRGSRAKMKWKTIVYEGENQYFIAESKIRYESQRFYLGIVMPLCKAEILPLKGIKNARRLRDEIIQFIYNRDSGGRLLIKNEKILDLWPAVLTLDGRVTSLEPGDAVVNKYGDIVYQLISFEPIVAAPQTIEKIVPYHGFFSRRGIACTVEGWPDTQLMWGWPHGPLSNFLRLEPDHPQCKQSIKELRQRVKKAGLFSLFCA